MKKPQCIITYCLLEFWSLTVNQTCYMYIVTTLSKKNNDWRKDVLFIILLLGTTCMVRQDPVEQVTYEQGLIIKANSK